MLCARRGVSWIVVTMTLKPISASDAAADAPARPLPTTITVYLRRLLGAMSLISLLHFVHLSAIGPSGTRAFNLDSTRVLMGRWCVCDRNCPDAMGPGGRSGEIHGCGGGETV